MSGEAARADHVHDLAFAILNSVLAEANATLNFAGQRLSGLGAPVGAADAVTKAYADAITQGLDIKASVRVATTANISLSGLQTIDGVALTDGDRVLVKNQTLGEGNGIYVVSAGAWARAGDADTDAEVTAGLFVFVEEGSINADNGWVLTTNNPITPRTTPLTFTQFSGAENVEAGAGPTKTGNIIDVGAGVGITVAADSIAIDQTLAPTWSGIHTFTAAPKINVNGIGATQTVGMTISNETVAALGA